MKRAAWIFAGVMFVLLLAATTAYVLYALPWWRP